MAPKRTPPPKPSHGKRIREVVPEAEVQSPMNRRIQGTRGASVDNEERSSGLSDSPSQARPGRTLQGTQVKAPIASPFPAPTRISFTESSSTREGPDELDWEEEPADRSEYPETGTLRNESGEVCPILTRLRTVLQIRFGYLPKLGKSAYLEDMRPVLLSCPPYWLLLAAYHRVTFDDLRMSGRESSYLASFRHDLAQALRSVTPDPNKDTTDAIEAYAIEAVGDMAELGALTMLLTSPARISDVVSIAARHMERINTRCHRLLAKVEKEFGGAVTRRSWTVSVKRFTR